MNNNRFRNNNGNNGDNRFNNRNNNNNNNRPYQKRPLDEKGIEKYKKYYVCRSWRKRKCQRI